ncbi:MAG: nucleotidyltransferase domain-containing protein [Myxococcaceae bacterium]
MRKKSAVISRGALKARLKGRLQKRCEQAFLFGSYARGEQCAQSDIDVIVVAETQRSLPERGKDFLDLVIEFAPMDLVVYTPDEWKRMKKSPNALLMHAKRDLCRLI